MENNKTEFAFENDRLKFTISFAVSMLEKARLDGDEARSQYVSMNRETGDNANRQILSAYDSHEFEALIELSQYNGAISQKIDDIETITKRVNVLEMLVKAPYFARIDFKFNSDGAGEGAGKGMGKGSGNGVGEGAGDDVSEGASESAGKGVSEGVSESAGKGSGNSVGDGAGEMIYIGRASLRNDKTNEIYIFDWRSPVAGMFYRFTPGPAYYDAPAGRITGEMTLKRQYEISGGKLEYYFDANVQIIDEFLRRLLSQNASPKMKSIVETIQKEQDIVIRDMQSDLLMVQGVAGSGKTSVALHRAAYLMYQDLSGRLSANSIMIISPNAIFEQYISNVLPELGEANVVSAVFEDLLTPLVGKANRRRRNQFLETYISGANGRRLMKAALDYKTSDGFIALLDKFVADIPSRWLEFSDIVYSGHCIVSKEQIRRKLEFGKPNAPLGVRLALLEDYILEAVKAYHRHYAVRAEYTRIIKAIKQFTSPNAGRLYELLFKNVEYLHSLAEGEKDDMPGAARAGDRQPLGETSPLDEMPLSLSEPPSLGEMSPSLSEPPSLGEPPVSFDDIIAYTRENLQSGNLYFDDALAVAYLHIKIYRASVNAHIRHVVIDEAQDYYPLHYRIISALFPYAKFTVLGDVNQTLEKNADMSFYNMIEKTLDKKKSILVEMDKSFRSTNEIISFSSRLLPRDTLIKSFNRSGDEPRVFAAEDKPGLYGMIAAEVDNCLKSGYKSVGLVCKSYKNACALYKALKSSIDVSLIKNESISDLRGVFIIPVYLSKGLEFDAVLICDADAENYEGDADRQFLYVACTRALHRLNLFCCGEPSRLLRAKMS